MRHFFLSRGFFVTLLLTTSSALLIHASTTDFATFDELAHIPAGLSHWETGSHHLFRVNPPLPRMAAVTPLTLVDINKQSYRVVPHPTKRQEGEVGANFAKDNKPIYFRILILARLVGVLWFAVGGLIVYAWSSDLFGPMAGPLALVFWCFEPNLLAHAHLVTPDFPATVAGLAACYAFWLYLRSPSWQRAAIAGVLLGMAQLTKYTWLTLYVTWPMLLLLHLASNGLPNLSRPMAALRYLLHGTTMAVISIIVINVGYEFDGFGQKLGTFPFISTTLRTNPLVDPTEDPTDPIDDPQVATSNRFSNSQIGELPIPLPFDYVMGLDIQKYGNERTGRQPSYLAGEWRQGGWWYFYLYALLVKLPIPLIILAVWFGFLLLFADKSIAFWRNQVTLLAPAFVILAAASSQMEMNRHLRYVLPVFPFVIIACAQVAQYLSLRTAYRAVLVVLLALWLVARTTTIHPYYLGYYNEFAGGPDRGHEHLLYSNTDWGQDLLHLQKWLEAHPEAKPVAIAFYHNRLTPTLIDLDYELPPASQHVSSRPELDVAHTGPQPGYYALSVTCLYRPGGFLLHDKYGHIRNVPPDGYQYFREIEPIAKAGYSIFIYHISHEQANELRRRHGWPQLPADRESLR